MSITEPATTQDERVLHNVHAHMALNPATVDAMEVNVRDLRNGSADDLVTIDLGTSFHFQTYDCDALDVAAALVRLADRIALAVIEHRQAANDG